MPIQKKGTSKNSRKAKLPAEKNSPQDTCFTIMPFGTWFDYYYETIYVPAIKATNLTPRRADDLYRPSAIVNDIWALTQEAKVVLADLSGKNPNVFYELGLAHALTKPAILVTESMEDVPFDLRSLRVIVYDKNEPNWGKVLQQKIETAIKEILASPLEAVLPTFLKVRESTKKTVTREEKELILLRQDMDLLKHQIQSISSSTPRISSPKKIISYEDALRLAETYLERNFSKPVILRLLVDEGVPGKLEAESVLDDAKRNLLNREIDTINIDNKETNQDT